MVPIIADPPGNTPRNFVPNESFALGQDGSDDAWRSIMPGTQVSNRQNKIWLTQIIRQRD